LRGDGVRLHGGTLGSWANRHKNNVLLVCRACQQSVNLPLPGLAARHGCNVPLKRFLGGCRCAHCGAGDMALEIVASASARSSVG